MNHISSLIFWLSLTLIAWHSSATTDLPLRTLLYSPLEHSQIFAGFSFDESSIGSGVVIQGITIQVVVEDCTLGARFFVSDPRNTNTASASSATLNITQINYLCAVMIQPINSSVTLTVSAALAVARQLWWYAATSESFSSSVRIGWTYWIDHAPVMSVGDTQHMFYCTTAQQTNLNYGSAVSSCQLWQADPADPSAIGATVAALYIPKVERLVLYLRTVSNPQYTDPTTGLVVGYVTLIGLFGTRSQWDNSIALTYKNFAVSNPVGSFPNVIDQNRQWKSVLAAEAFPYCCESTATGSTQQSSNGFVAVIANASSLAQSLEQFNASMTVVKPSVQSNFETIFPFTDVVAGNLTTTLARGFVASIHADDCDGSFRFSFAEAGLLPLNFSVNHVFEDDLCAIRILPSDGQMRPISAFGTLVAQIGLIDIRSSTTANDVVLLLQNVSLRLVWGFLIGGSDTWVVNGSPVPHFYSCNWGSRTFEDADDACASLMYGEAYLATPQFPWEQSLLQSLVTRSTNLTLDNVWIGFDALLSSATFANGDAIVGYTNWAAGQPSLAYAPAALSSIDGSWISQDRSQKHSYCCEWTSVPSTNASGVITLSLVTTASFTNGTTSGTVFAANTSMPLRSERPFSSLVARMGASAAILTDATLVYGVTIQVAQDACDDAHGMPLLAPPSQAFLDAHDLVLCPQSNTSSCTSASRNAITATTQKILRKSCVSFMRLRNSSGAPGASWLSWMEPLILVANRLPLNPFATNAGKGRFSDDVTLSWMMWSSPPAAVASLSDSSPGWVMDSQTLDTRTGHIFLCPMAFDVASSAASPWIDSWLGALEVCRSWSDDAYLATISDENELSFLVSAFNLTSSIAADRNNIATQFGDVVWLGLLRNASKWINGDPVAYTNWANNEPSGGGPTVASMTSSLTWKNIPIISSSSNNFNTASVCCKRNGFNPFSSKWSGRVTVHAQSISVTVSPLTPSSSGTRTTTRSHRTSSLTPGYPSHSLSNSQLSLTVNATASLSRTRLSASFTKTLMATTSEALTTPRGTISKDSPTLSQGFASVTVTRTKRRRRRNGGGSESVLNTLSRQLSLSRDTPTLSSSKELPATAQIDLLVPVAFRFAAADIRSDDASRRCIILSATFTQFRNGSLDSKNLSQWFEFDLSSAATSPTFSNFIATGGAPRWISSSSIALVDNDVTKLQLTLPQTQTYAPDSDEHFIFSVARSLTTMLDSQPPVNVTRFTFHLVIMADDADSAISSSDVGAATVVAALSFGCPSAVRDLQFMHLMGHRTTCARFNARKLLVAGLRVVAPAYWDSKSPTSLWVGAGSIPFACFMIHLAVLLVRSVVVPDDPHASKATRFPSLSVLVIRAFLVSSVTASISLLLDSKQQASDSSFDTTSFSFVAGVCSILFWGIITLCVMGWALACSAKFYRGVTFETYSVDELKRHSPALLLVAANGKWGCHVKFDLPTTFSRENYWWIIGEYNSAWYVALDWLVSWFMAVVVTYEANSLEACRGLYVAAATVMFFMAALIALWRPFAAPVQLCLAVFSYALLGGLLIANVNQLSAPDGGSSSAFAPLRWMLTATSIMRSIAVVLAILFEISDSAYDGTLDGVPSHSHPGESMSRRMSSMPTKRIASAYHRPSFAMNRANEEAVELDFEAGVKNQLPSFFSSANPGPSEIPPHHVLHSGAGRHFSMGSMRRFGSYARRFNVALDGGVRMEIPDVESEGDDQEQERSTRSRRVSTAEELPQGRARLGSIFSGAPINTPSAAVSDDPFEGIAIAPTPSTSVLERHFSL